MSKEAEIETKGKKGVLMYLVPALIVKVRQNAPVTPQYLVNIAHITVGILVLPVVVVVSALIRAEFFIGSASQDVTAIETIPFHNAKVLIKIVKNVLNGYKR